MNTYLESDYWMLKADQMVQWLITVGPGILLIIVTFFIAKSVLITIVTRLMKRLQIRYESEGELEQSKRMVTLLGIVRSAIHVTISIVFLLVLLDQLGINIAPLIAGAGIIGLAIGFGAQELVRDVISGFFMLLENHVRVGDVVNINGTGGAVEKIELRTIALRDFSQVVHIFQHGKINSLSNMTMEWSAMAFDIGVAYKEDPEKVMKIMQVVGAELESDAAFKEFIIHPIEIFGLDEFGDSAIVIKARYRTKPGQQWPVAREYRKRLKYAFDQQGIEIPFPHRTIYWGEQTPPLKVAKD